MKHLLAVLLPLSALAADAVPIQRYLSSLRLGDTLEDIRSVYPPKKEWPSREEPNNGLIRMDVEREYAKSFPASVAVMRLWLKWGRLVRLQMIYDKDYSRRKPLHALVLDYAVIYGEPRRAGLRYFWSDSATVLRASNAELPSEEARKMELHTSLELMNRDVFRPRG